MTDGRSVGEVARQLGIAVTTLRTWHQRYGLGPTGHAPGRHRRYTPEDLDRLATMLRLTQAGVPPAEAARRALAAPASATPTRDGGGRAIPVGRAAAAARGLARAALRLDAAAATVLLADAVAADGVVATWEALVVPVLQGIGARHAATGALVDVEHLLSGCVSAVLAAVPRPDDPPRILLACAEEEQHSLPLEALAAALAEHGVPVRQLGARVPLAALCDAVRRTGPHAVVVWAHERALAVPDHLVALTELSNRPSLVVPAGPGWAGEPLPTWANRPETLSDAVTLLVDDLS
jgi:DNA-binding transcriptional MerR regulator